MMPINHNNDQHGMVTLKMQQWHACLGGNQWLSNQTKDALNKRKTMHGTGNLANYSAMKSWILVGGPITITLENKYNP